MGKYSEVIRQLVGAAKDRGLFSESQIFALADGAIGLKEALEDAFPQLQFILDRPHLKQHIYQGIEAMELPKKHFHPIFDATVSLIDAGKVRKIIKNIQNYKGTGAKEIETLANYLIRFRSLRSLSKIS
ncbi:MAG: hypothetical protein QNJ65_01140 [Xenococcaceae cyanobacterium MO_234.B1]|nr:hypothetical protein [Xenococcaceae cyanobacterium MO_234.B1]